MSFDKTLRELQEAYESIFSGEPNKETETNGVGSLEDALAKANEAKAILEVVEAYFDKIPEYADYQIEAKKALNAIEEIENINTYPDDRQLPNFSR